MKTPNRIDEFVSTIQNPGFRNGMKEKLIENIKKQENEGDEEKNEIPV